MTKYSISRAINGISINGDEYVIKPNGDKMLWDSLENAQGYLLALGYEKEELEFFNFNEEVSNGKD